MSRSIIALVAVLPLVLGCGSKKTTGDADATDVAVEDLRVEDAGDPSPDPIPDADPDPVPDTPSDTTPDAAADAAPDTEPDPVPDASDDPVDEDAADDPVDDDVVMGDIFGDGGPASAIDEFCEISCLDCFGGTAAWTGSDPTRCKIDCIADFTDCTATDVASIVTCTGGPGCPVGVMSWVYCVAPFSCLFN